MLRKLIKKYCLIPACKMAMQLTKPQQNIAQNTEEGLRKIEQKYLQLPVNQKVTILVALSTVIYLGGLTLLSFLWYKQQRRSSFHFFNDNPEWQQMDKFGHAYTAFHLSHLAYAGLIYAGLDKKTALKYGAWAGAVMMTPIEILDGFSEGYGASWGDEVANFVGSAFFLWQQKQFGEIRFMPQFFFKPSKFAKLRPELLGKNLSEQWLKDYNGQVYWLKICPLTFNLPFIPNMFSNKFSNFSLMLGYGAGNMIYGRPEQNIEAGLIPYREFYVGIGNNSNKFINEKENNKLINKAKDLIALPIIWWKF
jgi:Predicted periplasmic lipoprotein (DUF2279)